MNTPSVALYCPFPTRIHPAAECVQRRALVWAEAMGLCLEARVRARMVRSRVGHLVARVWPDADPARLQVAADWTLVFCLLDDQVEGMGALTVGARLSGLLAVLDGRATGGADPLAAAMMDLRERMVSLGGEAWMARFVAKVEALFSAFVWESVHRGLGHAPDLASYWTLREQTVGLHPLFLLGELMDELPAPEVLAERRLSDMAAAAARVVGWANDVFTCEREAEQGEIHNLVMVLAAEQGDEVGAALPRAVALHDREVRHYERLEADLLASGGVEELRYARMLRGWMRGHLEWARETGRYQPESHQPEAQRSAA